MAEPLHESEFPHHLRKNRWFYRLSYVCVVAMFAALVFTTPRTIAIDKKTGHLLPEITVPACLMLGVAALIYFSLQASDPGFLNVSSDGVRMLPLRSDKRSSSGGSDDGRQGSSVRPRVDSGAGVGLSEVCLMEEGVSAAPDDDDDDALAPADAGGESDDESESSDEEEDLRIEDEVDEELDGQLLGLPTGELPLRSKYCRHSRRVVATFDHYCLVLGTCIGERNHARFWWLLFVQSVTIWTALGIVHSGFHDTKAVVSTWVFHNGHAMAAAILLWLLFILVGGLLGFHTFLMMTNMTSYEFMRSEKISYLRGTKDFDLPFSEGLRGNLRFFCCADGAVALLARRRWGPREWRPFPPIVRDSEDWANNLWENKYWSCC